MPELAPPASDAADLSAELASARGALRGLDKASRAVRTYGFGSAVTERFIQQLLTAIETHLFTWVVLGVTVEPGGFRLGDEVVWRSEESVGEGLSFRLYADGIRELRFHDGFSDADLRAFLEALWGKDASADDDDVVTRLWAKDLATVSFVTAEDILKVPWVSGPAGGREGSFFALPPASFKGVIEREQVQLAAGNAVGASQGAVAAGSNLKLSGAGGQSVVGFEVAEADRQRIAAELAKENGLDGASYVIKALRAILVSERGPDLLTRVLALAPALFDALLAEGRWTSVHQVLTLLDEGLSNPAFEPAHHALTARALDALSAPSRVALIATGLNADPARPPDSLVEVLARLQPAAVGALCGVLAEVESREHRWVVREALARLGRQNPEPVMQGLAGPKAEAVRDLIEVIASWELEPAVEALAMLAHHADADVRRDALAAIAALRTSGDGAVLAAFASDPDRAARLQALRLLMGGAYQVPWEAWVPHTRPEAVADLPGGDRRALLLAMRATSGDAMVPFLASLLPERAWAHRQKGEQAALSAVDALALRSTPEARAALEAGQQQGSPAVQRACAAALQQVARRAAPEEKPS